jgi:hypothetical protein
MAVTTFGNHLRLVGGALRTEARVWEAHDPQDRRESVPGEPLRAAESRCC